jgi:hypothetical protein
LARGLLLGAAGFLPMSPSDAAVAGLDRTAVEAAERAWQAHGAA